MTHSIAVENIKCGGCANSTRRRLLDHALVAAARVDIERGTIRIRGNAAARDQLVQGTHRDG